MYFSKESVIALYKKLSNLYPKDDIEQQGGTQFVSEIKYFLATDYFKKQKGKACDVNIKDDKEFFVLSVGKTVLLSDDGTFLATKNFSNSVGDSKDFDVGSNFFSANAVAVSKKTFEPQKFPNRHPQLLSITKGIVDTYSGGYDNLANDKEYLGGSIKKYALLFLWLNRFSNFSSKDSVYNDSLFNLKKDFSSQLISSLQFGSPEVKQEVEDLVGNIELVERKPTFEKEDFVTDIKKKSLLLEIPIETNSLLSESELSKYLADEKNNNGTYAIHLFGIKYAKLIQDKNLDKKEIIRLSEIGDNYFYELSKGIGIYNLAVDKGFLKTFDSNSYNELIESGFTQNTENVKQLTSSSPATPHTSPEQIIYYGVPGSGKSHTISERLKNKYKITDEDLYVERTVFHPEYTNADFIGQIIPRLVQGKTDFQFKPGPFTSILKKALYDSEHRYVLIIEEINRGNAAAIFGEIFQLLDRVKNGVTSTEQQGESFHNHYGKGWSDYFVMNSEMNNYIRDSQDSYDGKAIDVNGIHFSGNTGIRLPPNLSILATMNTSDQNVFTLDNAFQRRWDMKIVENVFGTTQEEINQKDAFVDSKHIITWERFQKAINIKIGKMSQEAGLSSMEDKRLGCWFVSAENKDGAFVIPKDVFAEKVLKYLWDDAFKFNREKIFNGYQTLEDLTKAFKGESEFAVFKDLFSEENA